VCGGIGLFTTQDSLVKWMSGDYPIHEILFVRCLATLPLLALVLAFSGRGFGVLAIGARGWLAARCFILFAAYLSMSLAIATITLADAAAIYFTLPLFVAGLAGPVLGERVPLYRWLAILAGFFGVVIMIRPGAGVLEPAAPLALASAFLYGLGQMLARKLRSEDTWAIAFYQNLAYLFGAIVLALVFSGDWASGVDHKSLQFLVRPWKVPETFDLAIMLSFALISLVGLPLYIHGYKSAPANFVAAFEYTGMFWSVGLGWLLFRDLPGWSTLAGAAVVVAAGLFMLWRDSKA
jgi:drug/metabolite transporter (DMT)-like permease